MENDNDVYPLHQLIRNDYDMATKICILHMHNRQNTSFTKQQDPIQMISYLYFL